MNFYGIGSSIVTLIIVILGICVMLRIISPSKLLRWGVILAVGWVAFMRFGGQFYSAYGNLGLFLVICAIIIIVMFRFQFTRQILAGVISAIIYQQFIRWIFIFTGAGIFLGGLAYAISKWIMI